MPTIAHKPPLDLNALEHDLKVTKEGSDYEFLLERTNMGLLFETM